mmetsp:Transcript_64/g.124  ORF Transcript_64/g.124 Transcript_64/m.124 type:complete len:540 (-) Transcript_64:163-1782(-)
MLVYFKDYMKRRADPERKKAQQAEMEKKLTILKQQKIEQFETNQSWNVVFGKEKPAVKNKDLPKFTNMTYRNIWMDDSFIYDQAVRLNPSEVLHSAKEYSLEWQPPDSTFRVMVGLTDQKAQADTLRRISFYPKPLQNNIVFYFTTVSKNMDLFGEKVHPSASESYHDRPSVLRKLCEKYMIGAMKLDDLNMILEAGYSTWKIALFNLLDEEEQTYHPYLQQPPPKIFKKSLERRYLDDNINLQQYEDLKFPIRKAKKDEEAMSYPRPYTYVTCIMCKEPDSAIVKCLHCSNMVCPNCIVKTFLNEETSEGSFLLLHRRYCVRLGAFPIMTPAVEPEPGYLRELRMTGLLEADKRHRAMNMSEEEKRQLLEEERRKRNAALEEDDKSSIASEEPEEEEEVVKTQEEIDNEPIILSYLAILESCSKKMQSAVPEIKKMHLVLDNPGRGETVRARIQRMKNEKVQKLERTLKKVAKCRKRLQRFDNLERVSEPLEAAAQHEETLRRVLSISTWAEYEEILEKLKQQEDARKAASLMSALVM